MSKAYQALAYFIVPSFLILGVTGCANVELKGGLVELAGLNELGKKQAEPKMKKRSTLVVPPTTGSLPVPGSSNPQQNNVALSSNSEAWPVDPDQSKAQNDAALKAQHTAFCEQARRRFELKIDAVLASGPLGSCEQSILRNFTGKGVYDRPSGS